MCCRYCSYWGFLPRTCYALERASKLFSQRLRGWTFQGDSVSLTVIHHCHGKTAQTITKKFNCMPTKFVYKKLTLRLLTLRGRIFFWKTINKPLDSFQVPMYGRKVPSGAFELWFSNLQSNHANTSLKEYLKNSGIYFRMCTIFLISTVPSEALHYNLFEIAPNSNSWHILSVVYKQTWYKIIFLFLITILLSTHYCRPISQRTHIRQTYIVWLLKFMLVVIFTPMW